MCLGRPRPKYHDFFPSTLLSLWSIFQDLDLLIFVFPINIEHKTISGCSKKHKYQDKENLSCPISKTKSKLVKFPFFFFKKYVGCFVMFKWVDFSIKEMNVIASHKLSQKHCVYLLTCCICPSSLCLWRFVYLFIVVKKPTKTTKIGGKGPAKKNANKAVLKSGSKSGIFIHCLYLKQWCMQKTDWTR